jgi:hypothetical protein
MHKNLGGNNLNILPTTHESCITTIHLLTRQSVRELLASKQITVLEDHSYSPDLAPSDFSRFQKIKEILKGSHFEDIHYIRNNTTTALKNIQQKQFQNCFEGCTRRWHQCIASQGEYFEGHHSDI